MIWQTKFLSCLQGCWQDTYDLLIYWLLLDSPLALGKTWTDVENQIYTVLNMDSTITVDAGSMDNCAVVDCYWNVSSMPTHYIRFFKPGVGVVYRNSHQEDENSLYDHTWELVNSNLLD